LKRGWHFSNFKQLHPTIGGFSYPAQAGHAG
jgi:hypothetical protein